MKRARQATDRRAAWWTLLSCLAAYGAAFAIWSAGTAEATSEGLPMALLAGLTAWIALGMSPRDRDLIRLGIDCLFRVLGLNLAVQYAVAYLFYLEPPPWFVITEGSVFAFVLLLVMYRFAPSPEETGGVLVVGGGALPDPLTAALAGRLATGSAGNEPAMILVNHPETSVRPRELMQLVYGRGIPVESASAVYEDVLQRVSCRHLDPADLLFPQSGSRLGLALQAVYTNLIGLTLLVALAPVMVAIALALKLFGGGPVLETAECLGFQAIPFTRLRFRTRRSDGSMSAIGRVVERLRLAHLPQLINLVRGEMGLFGPPPVRRAFGERLTALAPAYGYRFIAKPGILGWSQLNLREAGRPADELDRLEFDLYYVKEQGPSFDTDILIRTALGRVSPYAPRQTRAEVVGC